MAIHKGPWEPVDTTKGVWLHADRDEFGHYTYTLGVQGEVYEITETAHEHLSKVWIDSRNQGAKQERERIIKLLEPLAQHDEEMCSLGCYPEDCSASIYQDVIELIRGEQK